jgi:hypothetical protein
MDIMEQECSYGGSGIGRRCQGLRDGMQETLFMFFNISQSKYSMASLSCPCHMPVLGEGEFFSLR